DLPGGVGLVGYFVPRAGSHVDDSALRSLLGARLPSYMVPTFLVPLTKLPLTTSGKVDRKALPTPAAETQGTYIAPEGELEEVVAAVYQEVLGGGRVSRKASFFALGGHSLLATQVVSRLRERLSVELPLRALFEAPTVEDLARRLAELSSSSESPIVRVER